MNCNAAKKGFSVSRKKLAWDQYYLCIKLWGGTNFAQISFPFRPDTRFDQSHLSRFKIKLATVFKKYNIYYNISMFFYQNVCKNSHDGQ